MYDTVVLLLFQIIEAPLSNPYINIIVKVGHLVFSLHQRCAIVTYQIPWLAYYCILESPCLAVFVVAILLLNCTPYHGVLYPSLALVLITHCYLHLTKDTILLINLLNDVLPVMETYFFTITIVLITLGHFRPCKN